MPKRAHERSHEHHASFRVGRRPRRDDEPKFSQLQNEPTRSMTRNIATLPIA
jgi:hypothetical protein